MSTVASAQYQELPSGHKVRVITAPLLVATKFAAFQSRGEGDYLRHDMEDIVHLVDGRVELIDEIGASAPDVRDYLREEFERLITDGFFLDLLPGHFNTDSASQARVEIVVERMRKIAGY
jgi:hypothetical protein